MLKYINEQEYLKVSGNESIPDNFDRLAIEASAYINMHTFGRIDSDNVCKEVKYATCLIADAIDKANKKKNEIGSLKSQNIEGWSETYSSQEEIESSLAKEKLNILNTYLCDIVGNDGKKLLDRGV